MVFGAAIRLLDGSPEAERAVEQIVPALWRGAPGPDAAGDALGRRGREGEREARAESIRRS